MKNLDREIVVIDWLDNCSASGWICNDAAFSPSRCRSVGLLVAEDDKTITICQTANDDNKLGDCLTIIKTNVLKKEVVK